MALMLVLSVSVVAAAEHNLPGTPLGSNAFKNAVSQNIDVEIDIDPFFYIAQLNTEPMEFNLETPAAMGEAYNIIRDFTFGTNTNVKVTLTEDFTGKFRATEALNIALLLQNFEGANNAFELIGKPGSNYAKAIYTFAPGQHAGKLNVGIGWYNTDATSQEAGNWNDLDWWNVLAGEYEGTITMTIEQI